jgi:hypothetical protein
VAGNAAIVMGGNFEQDAASLNVGGALGMSIGVNVGGASSIAGRSGPLDQ